MNRDEIREAVSTMTKLEISDLDEAMRIIVDTYGSPDGPGEFSDLYEAVKDAWLGHYW